MTLVVKNLIANTGRHKRSGLIPGSRRSPEEELHSYILAWKIPQTEEPGRLQSMGSNNEMFVLEKTWMDSEGTVLSEINQAEKEILSITTYMIKLRQTH